MTSQPASRPWAEAALGIAGPQPDQRSCGAACLVVARMLASPSHAERVRRAGWSSTVLRVHREAVGLAAPVRRQLPWLRALGTPPWVLARELSTADVAYRTVPTRTGRRQVIDAVADSLDTGHPVAWYVGTRRLPRHVVLVVGYQTDSWLVWEPSAGKLLELPRQALQPGPRRVAGWRESWALVAPRVTPRPGARRTRA